ncbi:MAG: hypothetical protein HOE53_04965 [Candidatus Magasanikbacteria bacterium]|jgi:hypothetical protein|nr:hypothetical protein [Candidatus Magasanikbacteria bacterium]
MAKKPVAKKGPVKKTTKRSKKTHKKKDEGFHDVEIAAAPKKKKHVAKKKHVEKKSKVHHKKKVAPHIPQVEEEPELELELEIESEVAVPAPSASRAALHMSEASKERISAGIESIYQDSDGSVPDLSTFQSNKRGRLFRSFLSFILSVGLLGGVVYAGLFLLQPSGEFVENDVILSVSGEEEITPGEHVRYRIRYRNAQEAGLHNVSLEVRYPAGFVYKESTVAPSEDTVNRWELGNLAAGDSGYIDVSGNMFGALQKAQSFRAFMTYTPNGFSSEFQKATTLEVNTAHAPATIDIEYPEMVASGVEVPMQFTITPKEGMNVQHMYLEMLGTGMFVKKLSAPESDQFEQLRWSIDVLSEPYILQMEGLFVSPDGIVKELDIPVQLVGYANAQKEGEGFVYASSSMHVTLQDTDISITPVVNGATKDLTVQPGEKLNISVAVRNQSDVSLKNVRVRAMLDGPSFENVNIFDWRNLEDELDGSIVGEQLSKTLRRGILTHTSAQVPAFSSFPFGAQEIIDFQIPIKNAEDIILSTFPPEKATLTVEMQYTLNGEQIVLSSSPITMTLNSDLALQVVDDVSTTNNPEDTHTVTWLLSNSFHPLKNVELSAEVFGLTQMVTSTAPAGKMEYNETTKILSWTIDEWPIDIPQIPMQFTLYREGANPSQTQLMSRVELRATDTVTEENMIIIGDELQL